MIVPDLSVHDFSTVIDRFSRLTTTLPMVSWSEGDASRYST
jgi:hypothetical protein